MNLESNSYQKKVEDMQEKLLIGRKRFTNSYSENDKMGCALLSYHGALEDYFRAYLSEQYPEEREKIQDVTKTRWVGLLDYARNPLGLSADDENLIQDANKARQNFAHGLPFSWDQDQLSKYVDKVEQFCSGNFQPELERYLPQPETKEDYQTNKPYDGSSYESEPWYHSSCFLWLVFFFMPPLWVILILTKKNGNVLVKLFSIIFIIVMITTCSNLYKVYSPNIKDVIESGDVTGELEKLIQTETVSPSEIEWEEYSDSDLGYKNRFNVWEEIVKHQVQGCDMAFSDFKEEVLKYNPRLVEEGYEFKKNIKYELPKCSNYSSKD